MNIKKFRQKKKLTQEQFANELGVSQGTISKAESGHAESSFKILCGLRIVYGFDVNKYIDNNYKEVGFGRVS